MGGTEMRPEDREREDLGGGEQNLQGLAALKGSCIYTKNNRFQQEGVVIRFAL